MKMRFLVGILGLVAIAATSCNKHNGCSRSEKAIVRDFSDTDTCGIVFELENGDYLEATNLNQFTSWEDEDLVWISYKATSGASECELGEIVRIRCVVEREF